MKIIQSLWSAPIEENNVRINPDQINGGWLELKYYYMSIALSCLTLRRYYPEVELVTDCKGKELLIDTFGLPYTDTKICLDVLRKYNHGLWALSKLYAYGIQDEAFLHVDNDVFIWEPFDPSVVHTPLVAQNPEPDFAAYGRFYEDITKLFSFIPSVLQNAYNSVNRHDSINAGVLGGTNVDFFAKFSKTAFDIINSNDITLNEKRNKICSSNIYSINMIIEQYLFFHLATAEHTNISYLFPNSVNEVEKIHDFSKLSLSKKYIHVLGSTKRNRFNCEQVEHRLRYEFPEYYFYISEKINSIKVRSAQVYYNFENMSLYSEDKDKTSNNIYKTLPGLLQALESCSSSTKHTKLTLNNIGNTFTPTEIKYIKQLLAVENIYNKLLIKTNEYKIMRIHHIDQIYQILDSCSTIEIIEQNLTTPPYVKFIKTSWHVSLFSQNEGSFIIPDLSDIGKHLTAISCINGNIRKDDLKGYRRLIYYFYNQKLSIKQLIEILSKDVDINEDEFSTLEVNVLNFIRYELVYSGYLQFVI